jgi:hypothetical protein
MIYTVVMRTFPRKESTGGFMEGMEGMEGIEGISYTRV